MLHKNVLAGDVHIFYNWAVADATALAALSLGSTDIGKVAWQQDMDQYKVLKNDTGPVWITLNPAAVSTLAASAISIVDAGGYYTGAQVETALQEVGSALAALVASDVAIDARLDTLEAKTYPYDIPIACGDESTAITTGTKVTFIALRAFTLNAAAASLTTAQASGALLTVDIKKNGTSIFTTKITIDNTETSSLTAAAAPALTAGTIAVAAGDVFTVIVDQIGASGAAGLKVYIGGYTT